MSAPITCHGDAYNFDNGYLPPQNEQHATSSIAQASVSRIPQAHTTEPLFRNGEAILNLPTFLGNLKKVSKTSRQLAVTRCLNSVMGANKSPWKAYPGHNKLLTLNMDINGGRHADQFHSTLRKNEEVEDWLQWRIQPNIEKRGQRSSRAHLKLLFVTLTGGETASFSATDDANVLKDVFEKWFFPTAALSVLLDRRATFTDQQTATNTFKKADKRSTTSTNRVLCAGMKQWVMVWSPDPQHPP